MARKRGALKGIRRVRRIMKKLPEAARAEIVAAFEDAGPPITARGKASAPGQRIRQALRWQVLPKSLSSRWGLIGRKLNRELFFARILEHGRGLRNRYSRWIKRRKKGGGYGQPYKIEISRIARPQYDFVFGRQATFAREQVRQRMIPVWEKALRRLAGEPDV